MTTTRFSHLRAGDLANLNHEGTAIPVKVRAVHDGNTATVEVTASRPPYAVKADILTASDNLRTQNLTSRTKSGTTLLVFTR